MLPITPTFLSLVQVTQIFSFATNVPKVSISSPLLPQTPQAPVPGDIQHSPASGHIGQQPDSVRANPEHTPNPSISIDLNVLKALANILTLTLNGQP